MIGLDSHPGPAELAAYGLGRLDDDRSAEIEGHLSACARCRLAVEDVPDDEFVALLRSASGPRETASGASPETAACRVAPEVPPSLARHPRYRVLELVESGGMGAVYKAEHRLMERLVALKTIHPRIIARLGSRERFAREVKAAARLSHPNIVTAFDADTAGDVDFLVMEYVEGTPLDRLVEDQGPLAVDEACAYARQAALALQHAYEHGLVHRDIKPGNLILTRSGAPLNDCDAQVKILDFGLSRIAGEAAHELESTGAGIVMGTLDYLAPEQAHKPDEADIRADIYSLGCTLYFLLAGRAPFARGTTAAALTAHLEQPPPPLRELRGDVPAELEQLIHRMLAKNPLLRPQTPAETAHALARFVCDARSDHRVNRRRVLVAGLAAAFVGLGAAGSRWGPAVYRFATNRGELVIETDGHGVQVLSGVGNPTVNNFAGVGNPIVSNSIHDNSGRGINLANSGDYAFTINDHGDADTGPNNLANYPVVTRVAFGVLGGLFKSIQWTLFGVANAEYLLQFFSNAALDPSGFGEGELLLGSVHLTTDGTAIGVTDPLLFPSSATFISATATHLIDHDSDPGTPPLPGATSEFSMVDTDGDAIPDAWEGGGWDRRGRGWNP